MKKILMMALALTLGFSSCVKDEVSESIKLPSISEIKNNPEAPAAVDAVTVSAKVSVVIGEVKSVSLVWTKGGVEQTPIQMSLNSGKYSGVIPAQPNGTAVTYKIVAANADGGVTVSGQGTYTVGAGASAGTQADIRINEINGTGADIDKYIELYNPKSVAINIKDMTLTYGGTLSWTGKDVTIAAGGYFVVSGAKNTNGDNGLSTGLSAGKGIIVELFTATGAVADRFQRGTAQDAAVEGAVGMDYSRIVDGTGVWYLTDPAGTKGVTNGTSTTGVTAVPDVQ